MKKVALIVSRYTSVKPKDLLEHGSENSRLVLDLIVIWEKTCIAHFLSMSCNLDLKRVANTRMLLTLFQLINVKIL